MKIIYGVLPDVLKLQIFDNFDKIIIALRDCINVLSTYIFRF